MKKLFLIVAVAGLFLGGCMDKNSVITLNPYESMSPKVVQNLSIYIRDVTDNRSDGAIVGMILDENSNITGKVALANNLASWYKNALITELGKRGATIVNDPAQANFILDAQINKFEASMQGYAKDNTKATAEVILKIYRGNETITKRVAQSQTKFTAIKLPNEFTPFTQNLIKEIVRLSAKQLVDIN